MLRRADRPARGRRGDLARLHGPHLRGPPRSAPPVRFVAYGDRKGVAAALRPSLHRPRRGGRPTGPRRLPPVRPGPASTPRRRRARERAWERNTAFLAFPPALRRVTSAPPTRSSRPATEPRGPPRTAATSPPTRRRSNCCGRRVCNIEDRRAAERAKEKNTPAHSRRAKGRLVEGQVTTNWKQALAQLAAAYPDRINPHL